MPAQTLFPPTYSYAGMEVRNIFGIRGTDPSILKRVADPIGPDNDSAILSCVSDARTGLVVAAWGNHGKYAGRATTIVELLKLSGKPVHCFALSGANQPVHPLYRKDDSALIRWLN
jgi:hypothetical protein